jgi:enoyl-CoA hydratase/carnithine racemase
MMNEQFGGTTWVRQDGQVAVIEFERAPHNFVSVELVRDIADALEAVDAAADLRASVLCSVGKSFSAGADLASPTGIGGSGMAGINPLYEQAARIFSGKKPIVAAVQGPAVGAGLGLALAADFRIAAPEARFAANFVKLGFHPGFAITHVLPRVVGEQRAALMCLTGRRIKGEEALAWGLVDELVPLDQVRDAALRLAREIAEAAPLAVVATRATLRAGLVEAVRRQTEHELKEQTWLRATADFAEGVRSVNERRVGLFTGA